MNDKKRALRIGRAVLAGFSRGNASREAQGKRLSDAPRKLEETHIGPIPLRADTILNMLPSPHELGRDRPASLRTVWRHLRTIPTAQRWRLE
jgi:hypothetical protein